MNNSRFDSKGYEVDYFKKDSEFKDSKDLILIKARRTAFIARFIVLREQKPSHAHRQIELLEWKDNCTAEEVAQMLRDAYINNKDNIKNVDRDIKRALAHASRALKYFIDQYIQRATTSFLSALEDYQYSNKMLFGDLEQPENKAWHSAAAIRKRIKGQTE